MFLYEFHGTFKRLVYPAHPVKCTIPEDSLRMWRQRGLGGQDGCEDGRYTLQYSK